MKPLLCLVLALACLPAALLRADDAPVPVPSADEAPSGAEKELKALLDRQRVLLAAADGKTSQAEIEDMRPQFQQLCNDYESYLAKYPGLAAGYVSYALLLGKPVLDERRRAAALLLEANRINPDLPVVKNQLGNYLAEEGRPLEALNYYLAAVKLAPKEPLYHYQIGALIAEARDDFLKSGDWTRDALDKAMREGFERAAALAPGNVPYAYRYCESFYDLEHPDWDAALAGWRALEARVPSALAKQTIRLHEANVLIKQGRRGAARAVLLTIDHDALKAQKQKLAAELDAAAGK